jgi:hypothetical protein
MSLVRADALARRNCTGHIVALFYGAFDKQAQPGAFEAQFAHQDSSATRQSVNLHHGR